MGSGGRREGPSAPSQSDIAGDRGRPSARVPRACTRAARQAQGEGDPRGSVALDRDVQAAAPGQSGARAVDARPADVLQPQAQPVPARHVGERAPLAARRRSPAAAASPFQESTGATTGSPARPNGSPGRPGPGGGTLLTALISPRAPSADAQAGHPVGVVVDQPEPAVVGPRQKRVVHPARVGCTTGPARKARAPSQRSMAARSRCPPGYVQSWLRRPSWSKCCCWARTMAIGTSSSVRPAQLRNGSQRAFSSSCPVFRYPGASGGPTVVKAAPNRSGHCRPSL